MMFSRSLVLSWHILAVAGIACTPSPNEAFARKLEQAASWAAAADLAITMRQSDAVPQSYLVDLLQHGAEDLARLRSKVSSDPEVASSARTRALALCERLASAFRTSAANG